MFLYAPFTHVDGPSQGLANLLCPVLDVTNENKPIPACFILNHSILNRVLGSLKMLG